MRRTSRPWLVMDIETIPSLDPEIMSRLDIRIDSRLKDPVKIAAARAEATDKAFRRTSLDPLYGGICSVAIKRDNGSSSLFTAYGARSMREFLDLEAQLLKHLDIELSGFVPCAWNGRDFDFSFVAVRAMRVGMPRFARFLLRSGVDPMRRIFGNTRADMVSLASAAEFFGVKHDESFDGSMVADAYARGEFNKISAHAVDDVAATWEIVTKCEEVVLGE